MANLVKSKTKDSDKNLWATTWECFADAKALYGREFIVDVCAEPETAKCYQYIASHNLLDDLLSGKREVKSRLHEAEFLDNTFCVGLDALNIEWPDDWWCNPPFDEKAAFIRHARKQHAEGRQGMMLLPYEPLTVWWRDLLSDDVIIYEPNGRYNFYEADGVTKKTGVNFGCAFVLFPACKIGPSIRVPFKRGIGLTSKAD